jgi:hypothetical protein
MLGQLLSCHQHWEPRSVSTKDCTIALRRLTYPPATKCAHDFATGAGLDAIALALSRACGIAAPVSRDCERRDCEVCGATCSGASLDFEVNQLMKEAEDVLGSIGITNH